LFCVFKLLFQHAHLISRATSIPFTQSNTHKTGNLTARFVGFLKKKAIFNIVYAPY